MFFQFILCIERKIFTRLRGQNTRTCYKTKSGDGKSSSPHPLLTTIKISLLFSQTQTNGASKSGCGMLLPLQNEREMQHFQFNRYRKFLLHAKYNLRCEYLLLWKGKSPNPFVSQSFFLIQVPLLLFDYLRSVGFVQCSCTILPRIMPSSKWEVAKLS